MYRCLLTFGTTLLLASFASASPITGQYLEARTCDVYTGACFANADTGLAGKHGLMAWKITRGEYDNINLDGLSIIAVVAASDTLGLRQQGMTRSVLIVDAKADAKQRAALIAFAKKQAGSLLDNVLAIRASRIDMEMCECKGNVCAKLKAGDVALETRCLDTDHDRGCGNDVQFYPPLTRGVSAKPAMAVEHSFTGKEFKENWNDAERRGAYVGSFQMQ